MATVRNRVVKGKKKKPAPATRGTSNKRGSRKAKVTDPRVTGFDLAKFSDDILSHRNVHGLTQRELGRRTGMTSAAIVFIENAKSAPLVGNFAKLCQYFKLNPNDYIPMKG